ncbi:MAG: condensin complex protein MksE [Gammaproteobacteria bacterium]
MFKHVVESLLSGHFICPTAYPDAFEYLSQAANAEKIDAFLKPLDRELLNMDGELFYAAYTVIDDGNRAAIREAFSEIRSQLRPVVEWMDLVMTALSRDMPIRARDEIRLHLLLQAIEHEPSLSEQLNRLTQLTLFKTSKTGLNDQLSWVLQKLEQTGYFVRPNPQASVYIATGKINYLHQVIAFLNDAENLELDRHLMGDTDGEQQGLF